MKPFRFRLSAMLIAVAVIGVAISIIARIPRYRCIDGSCDGFFVQAMWEQRIGQPSKLLHVLAFPDGDMHGGGSTELALNPPGSHGVASHPFGVYVEGTRMVPPNGYGVWVYLPNAPKGDVRFIEIPRQYQVNVDVDDFDSIQESEMWRRFVRPALVEESLNWRDEYERKSGIIYRPSRFPRREKMDWAKVDDLFPSEKSP